jgi:hypothetical protein
MAEQKMQHTTREARLREEVNKSFLEALPGKYANAK